MSEKRPFSHNIIEISKQIIRISFCLFSLSLLSSKTGQELIERCSGKADPVEIDAIHLPKYRVEPSHISSDKTPCYIPSNPGCIIEILSSCFLVISIKIT